MKRFERPNGLDTALYKNVLLLEWTTSLDTSSSTLFVCRGPGTGDRGLCPAGFIAHLRLYRYIRQAAIRDFFYLQSVPTRSLSTLVG